MAKSTDRRIYRVIFQNQGKVFEIFARQVSHGSLFGFVEVEELVFGEKSTVIVDPGENALRQEFEHTRRVFIPLHSVIRIDEQEKSAATRPRVVPMENGNGKAEEGHSKLTPIYTPPGPFGK